MSGRRIAALLLAIGALVGAPVPAQTADDASAEPRSRTKQKAVIVVVRVDGDKVEILHVSPSDEPDPDVFDGARTVRRRRAGSRPPADGILFEALDADLNVLGPSRVIPHRDNYTFYDKDHAAERGGLNGGLHPDTEDVRVFDMPVPPGTAFLRTPGQPVVPIERPTPTCAPCVRSPVLLHPTDPTAARPLDEAFDIVILGDGFAEEDQRKFLRKARSLADGLLAMEPYQSHADRIQIHAIPAVSRDTGVSNFPTRGVEKQTCYDVTGFWHDEDYGGFVGTPQPHRIWDAVACSLGVDDVELKVMLVNIPVYGGRGDHDTGTAFVDMYPTGGPDGFVALAAHEMAHALVGLADEYVGCEPVTGVKPTFANVTTSAEIEAGRVPWIGLATPGEKGANGQLAIVDTPSDDPQTVCTNNPDLLSAEYEGKLGLFWGAAFIDAGEAQCGECSPYGDPRGKNYYRPMATCRMRNIFDDFCRVCAGEIEKSILAASTPD